MKPTDVTLSTIAEQITDNRATDNIQFWLVVAVLAFILFTSRALLRSYLAERGRLLAAAETLNERMDEIRKTTDASERIKVQIAHNDWTLKEFKTLRRTKLEDLISSAFKLLYDSETDMQLPIPETPLDVSSRFSLIELEQISSLYFPEFDQEIAAIVVAHGNLSIYITQERSKIRLQHMKIDSAKSALDTAFQRVPPNHLDIQDKIDAHHGLQTELGSMHSTYTQAVALLYQNVRVGFKLLHAKGKVLMAELTAPTVV